MIIRIEPSPARAGRKPRTFRAHAFRSRSAEPAVMTSAPFRSMENAKHAIQALFSRSLDWSPQNDDGSCLTIVEPM